LQLRAPALGRGHCLTAKPLYTFGIVDRARLSRALACLTGEQAVHRLSTFLADESGASAAEYALILALVAIVIIGGLTILGTTINTVLTTDSQAMQ
jgi:pilus assembly protein Flp/PilA